MSKKLIAVALVALMLLVLPASAAIKATSVEIRGTVANETAITGGFNLSNVSANEADRPYWTPQSFAAFYYDVKDNIGKETLTILQTDLTSTQRTIEKDKLTYSTEAQQKTLKVVTGAYAGDPTNATAAGLEQTASGKGLDGGKYWVLGWQAERYVALNGKVDKLSKLLVEQGSSSSEKKTLTVGETWDIGDGWTLSAQSIDAKASPRQVWLVLSKDGVKKDDKVISEKKVYTYVEKSLASETDVPVFVTYIDSVFAGATTDMVQLRYTWLVSSSVIQVKSSDKFGIMEVVTVDTTNNKLSLNNTDSTLSLTPDSTVDIMGNMKFKVADKSDVLRFYPMAIRTQQGTYEVRGTVWNETATDGAVNGTAIWTPQSFAAFYYDVKGNIGKETLTILQNDLASAQRTIEKDKLTYSTEAQQKTLKVVTEAYAGIATNATAAGLEQTATGKGLADGKYWVLGWQAERYVALNSKVDKLSKLLVEQGSSSSDKKTLTVGETWDIGDGWTLSAQSIDAKASPRQVWLVLSKDGVKKDDKVISEKKVYTYVEKSLASETDVPVFVTYIDSVFAGATTDMVQLKYTWLVSSSVTQVKSSDKFGIMEVVTVDTTNHKLSLNNTDSTLSLTPDSTVDIMGELKFKVADQSDVLRFYPMVEYVIGGDGDITPTPTTTATATSTAVGETPAGETPAGETPASETPAGETPASETPAPEPTKTPGFEAVFAIAGLLAVAFLVLRQRK